MNAERLQREFSGRAAPEHGGLLVFRPNDALALVARAAEEGVPILGVDAFIVTETSSQSRLEHLADFSSGVAAEHGCWQQADAFIRARRDLGLVFELTLGDDAVERFSVSLQLSLGVRRLPRSHS